MDTIPRPSDRRLDTILRTAGATFPGWTGNDTSLFSWAGEDTVRAAVAGAARSGVSPKTLLTCRAAARNAGSTSRTTPSWKPTILIAGPVTGPLEVLTRHLATQETWAVERVPDSLTPVEGLDRCAPDLLLMVWTDEPTLKLQVAAIRHHANGRRLPTIVVGSPPKNATGHPVQPVRGLLCLPRPLKWRTLLLCLDEHLRAIRRRSMC